MFSSFINYFTTVYINVLPLSISLSTIIGISDGIDKYSTLENKTKNKYTNLIIFIISSIVGGISGFAVGLIFPFAIPFSSCVYLYNKYI